VRAIKAECSGLEIAAQVQLQTVAHPPSARGTFRSAWPGLPFDPTELVFGVWIEALQLQHGKAAAFLRGIREGKNHGLILVGRDRFGGGEFAAIARADQPVEIAAHNGSLRGMISSDQPLGGGKVLRGPMIEIGANA